MAQYAGMCNGGRPEDGFSAVSQDATTSNALQVVSLECVLGGGSVSHWVGYAADIEILTLFKRVISKL